MLRVSWREGVSGNVEGELEGGLRDNVEGELEIRSCYSVGPTVCMVVVCRWMCVCVSVCVGMHVHLSFFY